MYGSQVACTYAERPDDFARAVAAFAHEISDRLPTDTLRG